jgi:predicted DCC family thiol-disulfide oxidoreductase YuxK
MSAERVVVFDGYCHICTGGVRFVLRHPVHPPFEIVPMQSDRGRSLLLQHGIDPENATTFLVLDGDRAMTESDASIHLISALGGIWRIAEAGRIVPKRVRDWMYRLLARNRYNWFGKRDTCYLP